MENPDLSASKLLMSFQKVNKYENMCMHLTDILLCICDYVYTIAVYLSETFRQKKNLENF